jgi:hypothetical protein
MKGSYVGTRLRARIATTFGLLLFCGLISGCQRAQPAFYAASQTIDFGWQSPNSSVPIVVSNRGKAKLEFIDVELSCSCTVAHVPKSLLPGEQTTIYVDLPKGGAGAMSAKVIISTNDRRSPHEFDLRWFREAPPRFDPPRIIALDGTPGTSFEREITLTYSSQDPRYPLSVKRIQSSDVTLNLAQTTGADQSGGSAQIALNRPHLGSVGFRLRGIYPQRPATVAATISVDVEQAGVLRTVKLPVEYRSVGPLTVSGALAFPGEDQRALTSARRSLLARIARGVDAALKVEVPPGLRYEVIALRRRSDDEALMYKIIFWFDSSPSLHADEWSVSLKLVGRADSLVRVPVVFLK